MDNFKVLFKKKITILQIFFYLVLWAFPQLEKVGAIGFYRYNSTFSRNLRESFIVFNGECCICGKIPLPDATGKTNDKILLTQFVYRDLSGIAI